MTRFWTCKSCSVLWAKFSGLHIDQCSSANFHWVRMQTVKLSALVPSVPSSTLSRDLLQTFPFYHLPKKKKPQKTQQQQKRNSGILLPNFSKQRLPLPLVILKFTDLLEAATIICLEDFFKCHSSKIKACSQIIETCQGEAFRKGSNCLCLCVYLDILTAKDQHLTVCGNF